MISLGFTLFFEPLLLHNATCMADLIAQGLHFFTHNSCTTVIKQDFQYQSATVRKLLTYSTGQGHCSITRVFHAWKSAKLHANSTRKTLVKHSCKNVHAKIQEKIHANQENLRVKLYTQIVTICVYSVYLSSYIAG